MEFPTNGACPIMRFFMGMKDFQIWYIYKGNWVFLDVGFSPKFYFPDLWISSRRIRVFQIWGFLSGDWVYLSIIEMILNFYHGTWEFIKIWGFLSPRLSIFQIYGFFIPKSGVFKIMGFLSRTLGNFSDLILSRE